MFQCILTFDPIGFTRSTVICFFVCVFGRGGVSRVTLSWIPTYLLNCCNIVSKCQHLRLSLHHYLWGGYCSNIGQLLAAIHFLPCLEWLEAYFHWNWSRGKASKLQTHTRAHLAQWEIWQHLPTFPPNQSESWVVVENRLSSKPM